MGGFAIDDFDNLPDELQNQFLTRSLGGSMVSFSNLELKLGVLFQLLADIQRADITTLILEAMRFRDKAGLLNKLVKLKVTDSVKLTVWNGLKPVGAAQGVKGIYGHLISAGEKRNQIAHATAGTFTARGKTVARLIPTLSNDTRTLGIKDLIDRTNYFAEVAKMLDWIIWAGSVVRVGPGSPPPKLEIPIPDLVRPLLNAGSPTPKEPESQPESSQA